MLSKNYIKILSKRNMRIYWQSNALNHNISFLFCRKLWQVEYTYGYLHLLFTFFRAYYSNTVCLLKEKYSRKYIDLQLFFLRFDSWTFHIKQQEYSLYENKKLFSTDILVSCMYRNNIDMLRRCTVLFWEAFWRLDCHVLSYNLLHGKKNCSNKLWCIRWRVHAL